MTLPLLLDAVVYDCDGLLAETESGWTRAETALFAEHGFGFGPAEKQLLVGGTLAAGGAAMARYFGKPEAGAELAERLAELVWKELLAGAPALPGARDLVSRVRAQGIPSAVASNSPRRFVEATLASAGLDDLFEVIVTADDVEHGKPAPDIYLRACELLGAAPSATVAFEDSRTGVASARAAGMFVVGVPSTPGAALEADASFEALSDRALLAWVRDCSTR
ncbi:HAD family hydrolase [Actinospica robiniae]|uniref:HAD family hydrolase n=1 Tax=Actinospica robiniae TaxID=304901 RepID=UPI0003FC975A|nr:HAD family phosphatase [Actinospica robiniae]